MSRLYEVAKFVESLPYDPDDQNATYGKIIIDPLDLEEKIIEFMRNRGCFPVEGSEYKYYVNGVEVTKQQYVAAERHNGFYNTIGFPEEPATASWSNSKTGDHGRRVYVKDTPTRS